MVCALCMNVLSLDPGRMVNRPLEGQELGKKRVILENYHVVKGGQEENGGPKFHHI